MDHAGLADRQISPRSLLPFRLQPELLLPVHKKANYDVERDFETFAIAGKSPMLFVTNASNPAKNMADAIAMAQPKPGEVAVGNPFRTSLPHLASEMAGQNMNVKFQQVSFTNSSQGIQQQSMATLRFMWTARAH